MNLAALGIQVYASDNQFPLINFWQHMSIAPATLSAYAELKLPFTESDFNELIRGRKLLQLTGLELAADFWLINKYSYSSKGIINSTSYRDLGRYRSKFFRKFANFYAPNLHVAHRDYREQLRLHNKKIAYLDPPYVGSDSYYRPFYAPKTKFDHEGLARLLHRRKHKWILSYQNHPKIYKLYKRHNIRELIVNCDMGARLKAPKMTELLITNY